AGHRLAGSARLADRVHLPVLRRILAWREPGHLPFVLLALGLPAHDQDALAGAEQVEVLGRLVAGTVPDRVLLPQAGPAHGILVPVARLAGEGNNNEVGVAVAIQVLGPAAKALAVDD